MSPWSGPAPVCWCVYLSSVKFPAKFSEEQHLSTKGLGSEVGDVGISIYDEKAQDLQGEMFCSQTFLPPSCQKLSSLLLGPHCACFPNNRHRVRHWLASVKAAHAYTGSQILAIAPSALHGVTHQTLLLPLRDRDHCYSHFTEEETEAQGGEVRPQKHTDGDDGDRIQIRAVCTHPACPELSVWESQAVV